MFPKLKSASKASENVPSILELLNTYFVLNRLMASSLFNLVNLELYITTFPPYTVNELGKLQMWLLEESKYENWFSKFKKSMVLAFSFWIIWIPLPVLSEENIFTGSSLLPLIEKGLYETIAALLSKSIDSPFFNCTLKLLGIKMRYLKLLFCFLALECEKNQSEKSPNTHLSFDCQLFHTYYYFFHWIEIIQIKWVLFY